MHVEDDDRHVAFAAKGESRLVHDFEAAGDGFVEGELVVFDGVRVFFRVGRVDSVDVGAFQQGVGLDFKGTQRGAGISGEEGVAGAAGNQGDASTGEDFHRLVAHVVFGHGLHGGGGKHLGFNAFVAEEHRQSQGVDDRGEHAHLVAVNAVEAASDTLQSAENVASASTKRQFQGQKSNKNSQNRGKCCQSTG